MDKETIMKIKDSEFLSVEQVIVDRLRQLSESIGQFNQVLATLTDGFQDELIIEKIQQQQNDMANLLLSISSVCNRINGKSVQFISEIDKADAFIY